MKKRPLQVLPGFNEGPFPSILSGTSPADDRSRLARVLGLTGLAGHRDTLPPHLAALAAAAAAGQAGDDEEQEDPTEAARERARSMAAAARQAGGPFTFDEDEDVEETAVLAIGANPAPYYSSNLEDPFIDADAEANDEADEAADFALLPSDALLLVARTSTDDLSKVDFFAYQETDGELSYHHDIVLEDFPLSLAWTAFNPRTSAVDGSFVAVGSFAPQIDVFSCDLIDTLEPVVSLGGPMDDDAASGTGSAAGRRLAMRASTTLRPDSHAAGGVLSLDWNLAVPNVLASGGADHVIKLWDVAAASCLFSFDHHKDKVCTVRWNPAEQHVLLTVSYDRSATLVDVRQQKFARCAKTAAPPETGSWDPLNPSMVVIGCESGALCGFDARRADAKPLWTVPAHEDSLEALAISAHVPGLLVTGSRDKTIKIWDCAAEGTAPVLVHTLTTLKAGAVFALSFFPDSPFVIATGGQRGVVHLCDLYALAPVREHFAARAAERGVQVPCTPEGIMEAGAADSEDEDGSLSSGAAGMSAGDD